MGKHLGGSAGPGTGVAAGERNASFLLRGEDLLHAESWQTEAASKEGKPTELQAEYIHESKRSAVRIQRLVRNSLIAGILPVLIGAGAAVGEAIAAREQLKIATSTSLANSALLVRTSLRPGAVVERRGDALLRHL